MAEELPQNLEMYVLHMIKGAFKSREVLEAEWPEHAPLDDGRVLLQNWTSLVHRQGSLLALLSVTPSTRAGLEARMPKMVNRTPAWMDAHIQGRAMTLEIFMQGLAETATEHREAIERVVAEQVSDPEPIEEVLAEAPVPAGTEGEDRSDLMSGVVTALSAHTKALVDIAYDLEVKFGRFVDFDEE